MHVACIFRGFAGIAHSLAIVSTVAAQYSGGSGAASYPLQIVPSQHVVLQMKP